MERELWTYATTWPHPKYISALTQTQEKVLSLLPIVPSLLSIWGSGQIIYMVIASKKKTPYRRILLGLSACDLFSSITQPLQPFLIPEDTSTRVWAVGNDTSCNFLGWSQQFFFSSLWYNGMLSIYFLLTVKYGVKDPQMQRRYEPWMHILSVGFPFVTATVGAIIGLYHELLISQGCWIATYPEGCGCDPDLGEPEDNCCTSHLYGWAFAGLPALVWFLVIIGAYLAVYCHVRSTIVRGRNNIKSEAVRMSINPNTPQQVRRGISRSPSLIDRQAQRIRAVATQGFFYVAGFFICYTPSFAMRLCEGYGFYPEDEAKLFPLLVAQAILLPGQGILNLFVYVRPAFNKARRDYPNESRQWAFRRAMFGDKIKPVNGRSQGRPFHTASTQFNVGLFASSRSLLRNLRGESTNNDGMASTSTAERPTLMDRIRRSSSLGLSSDDDAASTDDMIPRLFGRIKRNLSSEAKRPESLVEESAPSLRRERPPNSILKDDHFSDMKDIDDLPVLKDDRVGEIRGIQDLPERKVSWAESDSSFSEDTGDEPPKRDGRRERRVSFADSDSDFSEENQEPGMGNSNRMMRLGDLNSSFSEDSGMDDDDDDDECDDDQI